MATAGAVGVQSSQMTLRILRLLTKLMNKCASFATNVPRPEPLSVVFLVEACSGFVRTDFQGACSMFHSYQRPTTEPPSHAAANQCGMQRMERKSASGYSLRPKTSQAMKVTRLQRREVEPGTEPKKRQERDVHQLDPMRISKVYSRPFRVTVFVIVFTFYLITYSSRAYECNEKPSASGSHGHVFRFVQ